MTPTNEQINEAIKPLLDEAVKRNSGVHQVCILVDIDGSKPFMTFFIRNHNGVSGTGVATLDKIESPAMTATRKLAEAMKKKNQAEAELAALQSAEQKTS